MRTNVAVVFGIAAMVLCPTARGFLVDEDFEAFDVGTSVSTIDGWGATTAGVTIAAPSEIDGRKGVRNPAAGTFRFARLDLAGIQPSVENGVYFISADMYLFGTDNNQGFDVSGNTGGDARFTELTWNSGSWNFRIWEQGNPTPVLNVSNVLDPGGSSDGLRTVTFRLDTVAETAEGLITAGDSTVSLGSASFPATAYGNMNSVGFFLDNGGGPGNTIIDSVLIDIPEPATIVLLGLGGLLMARRRPT